MSDVQRILMIGAGGMAKGWLRRFMPNFSDRLRVVGLVDVNGEALAESGDFLELPAERRFDDTRGALDAVEADAAFIVVPPAFHTPLTVACLEAGLDVLCEKPISDTWDGCLEMLAAKRRTGRKVQIIQNYRDTPRVQTVRSVLSDGRLGALHYLYGRFAADYRVRGAWGMWRHSLKHSLLLEGAVHHFDQLRHLSGGDCRTIAGFDWNPAGSSFDHESSALFVMLMDGDVRAVYEGNNSEGGWQNSWHREYYRAECQAGAVLVDSDDQVKVLEHDPKAGLRETVLDPVRTAWPDGHSVQIDRFLTWRDGGPQPPTVLDDNLKSAAMLFAAIRASETGQVVDVAAMAAEAGEPQ